MSGARHGVGDERLQISCSIFLIVFFSFTLCVVQCEETPGKKDPTNEVPPLNHNSTDAKNKTKKPLTSSPNVDDKKDVKKDENVDQEKNANADISSDKIVPAVKDDESDKSSELNEEKKLPSQDTKKPAKTDKEDSDKKNEVDNSDENSTKSIDKSKNSEIDTEKSKTDKADASSGADDYSESEESSKSEDKKTESDHVDKDESGDVTNGKKDSDSGKEVPAIATNKTEETASKPNAGKSSDSSHSQHSDSTPNLTSPSLSDQSVKTNQEPQEFFRTLKPRITNPGNDHNFSFFRLFIVTSVFFVALYVGYYYRHKIKRHFGYNNNEIYYHPLRTMQHNAVD